MGRIGKHLKMDGKASGGKMQRGICCYKTEFAGEQFQNKEAVRSLHSFQNLAYSRATMVDCLKIDERFGPFLPPFFERVGEI